ncbi:uncharacterized protein LOC119553032 [Drosophila subpulchrella]|uniref:uncharacterized protein LOC119553032 n=1 Tax=Drosophila subpulchrella TaxID=1486046 RepID=UPI0018A19F81|nr:uncharacterized protein LOC119553032 [Drosophila subpulchrella]
MSGEANITPQSGRRPRLGLGRRGCQSTPLMRLQREESSVNTPINRNQETPRALALYLSARRIGLSKNRTELTKKKLEFAVAQENKDDEPEVVKKSPKKEAKATKRKSDPEKNCHKSEDEELEDSQKNQQEESPQHSKITELQGDIEIWHRAFKASVDDLLTMAEPGLSKKHLLAQLGIPLEMLRYLEED